jgi:putative hydrolase
MGGPGNQALAAKLREMADVLAEQQADGFRISAYRRAANTIELLERPIREIAETGGLTGLLDLPGIGRGAIMEMLCTGRWASSSG